MGEALEIISPEIERGQDEVTVRFELDLHSGRAPFFFRIARPEIDPERLGEAMICTALMFAMKEGRDLHCELPVSDGFLANKSTLQTILHRWFPELEPVKIQAPRRVPPCQLARDPWEPAKRGAAVLFSGGVDSFHTALEFQEDLNSAIYIHGFDTKLEDANYRHQISEHLQAAAGELDLQLIEVETNFRDHSDEAFFWGHCHFALVSAVCHLLSANFERVFFPSSYTFEQLEPWGQHPLTDPLWGGGDLLFIHHGSACSRVEKVAAIAGSEVARRHLRVCWDNIDEAYNCGQCEKCLRTMINLKVIGELDAYQHLFGKPLHVPDILPWVCVDRPAQLLFLQDNLHSAKRLCADEGFIVELESVYTMALDYFVTKRIALLSGKATGDYFASAAWREHLLPKVRNQLFDEQCCADPEWLAWNIARRRSRDELFDLLWKHDRKWLRQSAR